MSTDQSTWREKKAKMELTQGSSAYQPNILLLIFWFCSDFVKPQMNFFTSHFVIFVVSLSYFCQSGWQRGGDEFRHYKPMVFWPL